MKILTAQLQSGEREPQQNHEVLMYMKIEICTNKNTNMYIIHISSSGKVRIIIIIVNIQTYM